MKLGDAIPAFVALGQVRGRIEATEQLAAHLEGQAKEFAAWRDAALLSVKGQARAQLKKILDPIADRFVALAEQAKQSAEVQRAELPALERASLAAAHAVEAGQKGRPGRAVAAIQGAVRGWKRGG